MRRFLHRNRWITLVVVGLMLFSTSSLAISRMTCLMAGRTVYSLGSMGDHCPEKEHADGPSVAPVCCVTGSAMADPMPFLSGASVLLPLVAVVDLYPPLLVVDGLHRPVEGASDRAPPLLLYSDRQVVLSVFRV